MNKVIVVLAIITSIIFTSCKSAQQKESTAKQNYEDTKISNVNQWLAFKTESKAKILDNEKKIAELKVRMNKPGNTFDGLYRTRIEKLEAENNELKSKLKNYNGNETEWETFKSDFNRDMNEIEKNIKDLFR
ncbi:hypothetical protein [Flavobacterium sp.]|uniref:hypothetical protein n=1 Tax=Flavobacterium sp. TaxID=239 RepID=UPI00286EB0DE|nr:hypothetical protein [Flavobacterium sp.]